MKYQLLFILILILITGYGCRRSQNKVPENFINKTMINDSVLKSIETKKIFFGHQSVGNNLMEGLKDLVTESGLTLNISVTRDSSDFTGPVFAHARVGRNKYPFEKIDDFCDLMENELGHKVDVAMFKFCYVDIKRQTNVEELFSYYQSRIDTLQKKFPSLKILLITAPVKIKPDGIKGNLNLITGRDHSYNLNKFNQLLRETYGDENLFDLALLEATFPDGRVNSRRGNFYLVNEYTNDGGHLNKDASRQIAGKLIEKLVSLQ